MDPRKNPYAPGAGKPPPELAGRDDLIERASIALDRFRTGRAARSFIYYGLRGVGKTVLLREVANNAAAEGILVITVEAPENRSLPGLLAPLFQSALVRLSRGEALKAGAARAMRVLAGFINAIRVKYGDVEVTAQFPAEPGVADTGDLDIDLPELLTAIGEAAKERGTAVALLIDELQYVKEKELASLIAALHRVEQHQLPFVMVAAGLPQLLGQLGRAKSYAERLFEFIPLGPLPREAAIGALAKPAKGEGVDYSPEAIEHVLDQSRGYPYFLQEWGKHCWDLAEVSPISGDVARRATAAATAELDASFFRVRFDRLTQLEKSYLRAMAELAPGPYRSGEIADLMQRKVTSLGPVRNSLIKKGMIFSLAHGENDFTVPLFDGFMKRVMPTLEP
jgi:hypothetical protein